MAQNLCNGFITGRAGKVLLYPVASNSSSALALAVKSFTFTDRSDLPDASVMGGNGFKSEAVGLKQATGSIVCLIDESVGLGAQPLCLLGSGGQVQIEFYPDCNLGGLSTHICCAMISGISEMVAVDDVVTFTIDFVSSGCYFTNCSGSSACSVACATLCS